MFGIFKKKTKTVPESVARPDNIFKTDVGMLGIWDYETYRHIDDYDSWEQEFVEDIDIRRNIKDNTYVPLNINSDGAYKVETRLGGKYELSEREQKYLMVSSQPYCLKSNGKIVLSGMENVGKDIQYNSKVFDLETGDYIIKMHLIAWDEEPGVLGSDGKPTDNALPDFIVNIYKDEGKISAFRQELETFQQEDRLR